MSIHVATDTMIKLNEEARERAKEKAEKAKEKAIAFSGGRNHPKSGATRKSNYKEVKALKERNIKDEVLGEAIGKLLVHNPTIVMRHFIELSDLERLQCAHDYFICGSVKDVAHKHNVIQKEMHAAAKQNWWQMEVGNLQREAAIKLKLRFTTILNSTLDQLEDRVRNGDVQLDRDGEQVRCPVSAQSLATITNVIFEKKIKLEDRSSGIIEGENRRLVDLANSLTMLVVRDAEVVNENDSVCNTYDEDTIDGA